jgi:hypothetical protein
MNIQFISDSSHPNLDANEKPISSELYTSLFEYNLVVLIQENYDPYPTQSENSVSFISKGQDKTIWTLSYDNIGYVHVQSFEKMVILDVSIYKHETILRSPLELSSYVLAAIKGIEIKYPLDDSCDFFQWRISYDTKGELKFKLRSESKHMMIEK